MFASSKRQHRHSIAFHVYSILGVFLCGLNINRSDNLRHLRELLRNVTHAYFWYIPKAPTSPFALANTSSLYFSDIRGVAKPPQVGQHDLDIVPHRQETDTRVKIVICMPDAGTRGAARLCLIRARRLTSAPELKQTFTSQDLLNHHSSSFDWLRRV